MSENNLAGKVIGCAMELHSELGHGLNESVYQKTTEGLLINIGAPSQQFIKKFKDYQPTTLS